MVQIHRSSDDLDQERPGERAIGDNARRAWPDADRQHPDSEEADCRGDQTQAGAEHGRESQARVFARRTEPSEDTCDRPARCKHRHAHQHPFSEPPSARDGTYEEMLEVTVALLFSCRGRLPDRDEGDEQRNDQKRHSEIRLSPRPMRAQLPEYLLDARRARECASRLLGDESQQESRGGDRAGPSDKRRTSQAQGQPHQPREQPGVRFRARPVGQDARAEVSAPGEMHGNRNQRSGESHDRQQSQRSRRGERLELLHPAERCCPSQPGEAGAGVGDHPQRVRGAESRSRVPCGLPPGGGQLARQGAGGEEDGGARDDRDREEAHGQGCDLHLRRTPDHDRDERGEHKEGSETGGETGESLSSGSSLGCLAGEQQLPTAGIFLAAEQSGRGQQAPDGAEDAQEGQGLPHGVAGDGVELDRRAGDGIQARVRPERGGKPRSGRRRWVGGDVPERRRRDRQAEDVAPHDPRAKRLPGCQTSHHAARRASHAGR